MPKKITATALVGLFISGTAMAQSWLCVGEQSAGFSDEKGKWRAVIFNGVGAFKIVIRAPTAEDKEFLARPNILGDKNPTWLAAPLGEDFPTMACTRAGDPAFIICDGAIQELR